MKVQNMSEPISGTAAGVAGWKIIGGLAGMGAIGAALAAFVVMAMTKPKTDQEWRVALACTFVGSLGGGAVLIKYLGVEHWSSDVLGLVAQGGLMFACGLPAWAIVRAIFIFIDKHRDADIVEIVNDVKGVL
jgi:hypothetical protein